MLILLPPSEGKATGGTGPAIDLDRMSWPDLARPRHKVIRALVGVCRRSPAKARGLLGLSDALDADRLANVDLETAPTLPAGHRYAGVLHDAFGYPSLSAAAQRRANSSVVVFSGLWGVVRPTDPLPAYRIGIGTRLPGLGPLPTYWRPFLTHALDAEVSKIGALDLRSSGYDQMLRPAAGLHRVLIKGPDGKRAASSYQSKVAKGRLARATVTAGVPTIEHLLAAAERIGLTASEDAGAITVRVPAEWGLIRRADAHP